MNRLRELWRAFHKWAKGWDTSIVVAVLIWIVLRSYLIEAFRIPSASMENTLLVGDFRSKLKGWDTSIVVAVVIWIVLRSYLIEAFRIPSASMENTLLVGDFRSEEHTSELQ